MKLVVWPFEQYNAIFAHLSIHDILTITVQPQQNNTFFLALHVFPFICHLCRHKLLIILSHIQTFNILAARSQLDDKQEVSLFVYIVASWRTETGFI